MISEELSAALERLAETEHLLVALDFDGTIAPTVDHPEDARALPAARDELRKLAKLPGVTIALVSGRSLDSLEHVSQAPAAVLLSGSHGAQFRVDGHATSPELTGDESARLEMLGETLRSVAAQFPGAWVESKAVGFALHTRQVASDAVPAAEDQARSATGHLTPLTVRDGKDVLEFSVVPSTKGDALTRLRAQTNATGVFFAGDDVTDEDGFAVLGPDDVGVRVGPPPTSARFRVDHLDAMPEVLALIHRLRSIPRGSDARVIP